MDKLVPELYGEYGRYINRFRAFPFILDGAKLVERRLLYSLYEVGRQQLVKSATVVGHCFSEDSLLFTTRGIIKISEAVIGDEVILSSGIISKIIRTIKNEKSDFYRITCDNGQSVDCTDDQKFRCFDGLNIIWKSCKDIARSDVILRPKHNLKGYIKSNMSSDVSYMLGLFASEGSCTDRGRGTRTRVAMTQRVCIDEIERILKNENIDWYKRSSESFENKEWHDQYSISFSVKSSNFDFCYRICSELKPSRYLPSDILSSIDVIGFIAGYIDGDGHIRDKEITIPITSEKLANQIITMLALIGIHSRYVNKVLNIYSESCCRLCELICNKLKIQYKKDAAYKNSIIDISKTKTEICENIDFSHILAEFRNNSNTGWYKCLDGKSRRLNPFPHMRKKNDSKFLSYSKIRSTNLIDKMDMIGINNDIGYLIDTYHVCRVDSVEPLEPMDSYDVEIEHPDHEIIVNGFCCHNCIGYYHPHGDESAYSSLVTIVNNGLAVGQGNWGLNVGVDDNPPAAMRYTEVKSSKDVLDMAFEYIKDVPYDTIEFGEEPLFLPTKLPICLIGQKSYCKGIGFGYGTLIPIYKESDLLKRLHWLLTGKKGKAPIILPITDCDYQSTSSDFEQLLTAGNARINYKGKYKKEGTKSIIIESIPPSKSFHVILKKFSKEIIQDKSLGWQDESKTSTKVRFTILKPRMLKMASLIKKLESVLEGSLTFDCNVCNTAGKVVRLSIDDMLLNVYKIYRQVVEKVLKGKIKDTQDSVDEMILVGKIKPILSIQLKKNPDDVDKVIEEIAIILKETPDHIKQIFDKFTIRRIFKVKTDISTLTKTKKDFQNKLENLDTYIWNQKYLGKPENDL